MSNKTHTYLCFCSLPERGKAKEEEFAIASAIVVDETIVSSKEFKGQKLLSLPEGVMLFSVVITNKRYSQYRTDDNENPHILLLSMLLERIGYLRKELRGVINTFLPKEKEQDYSLTLRRLEKEGIPEDWYGFKIEKEIFQGINADFINENAESLKLFFQSAESLNSILKRKLQKELTTEEIRVWQTIKEKYYKSPNGRINGYGVKIYPNEFYYRFL